jgi:biotin carboxyl carrier protein
VTFEVVIDGRPARLTIQGAHFRYEPDGAAPIEREFSLAPADPGSYSVIIEGRGYDVVPGPEAGSAVDIRVNGRTFSVQVFDPREMRGRQSSGSGEGTHSIRALMPGKVVRVLVKPGELVEAEQGLVVVEAMKMQNEMNPPKAGRVAEVRTSANVTVAAGEVLVVIE